MSFFAAFLIKWLSRYYSRLLFISAIFFVLIFLLSKTRFQEALLKETITEGVVGTYTRENLPIVVTSLLSAPLVKIDGQGFPKPNLIEPWQVSKEATKYTFRLKNNIKWLDSKEIVASDLEFPIPDTKTKLIDEKTFELILADSFSPLPTLLASPIFKKGYIGTGPYEIEKIETSQIFVKKIILKSMDNNLPKVIIKFYPNEKIAKNALRIGEIQGLMGVNDISEFKNEKPFKSVSKTNYNRIVAIFYNTKDPVLSDRNFRLALSFGAPSIKGEKEAKTSIPPHSFAFNKEVRDFLDNKDEAKEHFNKVKKGKDNLITLTATSNLKDVGEKIVSEWKNLGINAVLRVESGIPQNFQMLLITQDIPVDPDQYSLWHSTQAKTNISGYNSQNQYSPRVDKDLEDGRKSADIEIRKERYQDLQKVLLDDAPAAFLYFPKYNVIYLKKAEKNFLKTLELQFEDMHLNIN